MLAVLMCTMPAPAHATKAQESWLEDDVNLYANPAGTLGQLRFLGVTRVRVAVRWQLITPRPLSRRRPRNFNAADPAAYRRPRRPCRSSRSTTPKATRDRAELRSAGRSAVVGDRPRRATRRARASQLEPVSQGVRSVPRAVATRYSGNYDPGTEKLDPGNPSDLPKVSFWSIWNEPDYGPSLAPQGVAGNLTIENSPRMYRNLLDAAWNALQGTGHAHDTFLFGELAPRGCNWGVFSGMKPLVFLRALYCVDSHYRRLRGGAAAVAGVPDHAGGSSDSVPRTPRSSGRRASPCTPTCAGTPRTGAPSPIATTPRWAELGGLDASARPAPARVPVEPTFADLRHRVRLHHQPAEAADQPRALGHRRRPPPTTSTGPSTSPGETHACRASTSTCSMTLSRRSPATTTAGSPPDCSTTTEPEGDLQRMAAAALPAGDPTRWGHSLEVWGCARPTYFATTDPGAGAQSVQIQFQARPRGPFVTLRPLRSRIATATSTRTSSSPRAGRSGWPGPTPRPTRFRRRRRCSAGSCTSLSAELRSRDITVGRSARRRNTSLRWPAAQI